MFDFLFRNSDKNSRWVPDPRRNLIVYIGWPLQAPAHWRKATSYQTNRLELEDGTIVSPKDVKSHLLVYPNNEAMGGTNLFYPFPPGITGLAPKQPPIAPTGFDSNQLERGRTVCEVSHSRFRKDSSGNPIYSTTIRNISNQQIRIERFAGFRRKGKEMVLNTVTGGYYTDEQFIAWYAAPHDGWIPVGGQATDDNNYGGKDCIWAYFGKTQDGVPFIATDRAPG